MVACSVSGLGVYDVKCFCVPAFLFDFVIERARFIVSLRPLLPQLLGTS